MDNKFILNFTPPGMIPTKEMTAVVPITPAKIIAQVDDAAVLGANMVHLHARDPQTQEPTYRKEIYAEIIKAVREKHLDLIICVSTSGRNYSEFAKRLACLELTGALKPDFGSLTLSSVNFNKQASINSPQMIQDLAKKMLDNGIRPELEVFDLGMVNYARYLIKKRLIKPPYYFNLILGNIACAQANLLSLGLLVNELPEHSLWSAGGGVRIGLEDNIYFDNERTILATNKNLVERILDIASAWRRTPYTHKEARQILGLN